MATDVRDLEPSAAPGDEPGAADVEPAPVTRRRALTAWLNTLLILVVPPVAVQQLAVIEAGGSRSLADFSFTTMLIAIASLAGSMLYFVARHPWFAWEPAVGTREDDEA